MENSGFSQKKWKYLSFGLIIVIGSGILVPSAFAASPTLNDIMSKLLGLDTKVTAIKAKTDNLPADPASQSGIEAALDELASSSGPVPQFANIDVTLNPTTGSAQSDFAVLPYHGKMYSGIISGTIGTGSGNSIQILCGRPNAVSNVDVLVEFNEVYHPIPSSGTFSEVFSCTLIIFRVFDINDGFEAPAATLKGGVQYIEATEVGDISN